MKFLQSFWFSPARSARQEGFAGFPHERLFWYAWALSLGLLRKYCGEVELVTDSWGKARAEELGLSHTRTLTELDTLKHVPFGLWALPKLLVYARQTEPFLHVDTDAFVLSKPPRSFLEAPIVCQGPETHPLQIEFYQTVLARMRETLAWLPDGYANYDPVKNPPLNCGLVGGADVELLTTYAKESLEIFQRPENQGGWRALAQDSRIPLAHFNSAVEQVNLAIHCKQRGVVPVAVHSSSGQSPFRLVHLVGGDKTNPESLTQLGSLLVKRMPKAQARIDQVFRAERAKSPSAPPSQLIKRAVHSFWFPEDIRTPTGSFGFSDKRSFWYAWVLSFLGLERSFGETLLFSTEYGVRVTRNLLGLNYSKILPFPEGVREVPRGVWNAGKFLVYLYQDCPFVHVDTDAIFWSLFPERLRSGSLVAERFEGTPDQRHFYARGGKLCRQYLKALPPILSQVDSDFTRGFALNCGVMGGANLELIHSYARGCLEVILHPENAAGFAALAKVPADLSAVIVTLEQLLVLDFCDRGRIMPKLLSEPCPLPEDTEELKYSHLYGESKHSRAFQELISERLLATRPDLKKRIDEAFAANEL